MAKKESAFTAAIKEVVADAIADDARAQARKERKEARLAAERDAPPPDPIAALQAHLATLDARLVNLREHQRRGDALAGKLMKHVETEKAAVLAKLRGKTGG